jgi:hypothetical protein
MNADAPGIATSIQLDKDSNTYVAGLDGSVYKGYANNVFVVESSYSKVWDISIGGTITWKIDQINEKSYLLNDLSSWVETVDPASATLRTSKIYGGKSFTWFIMEDDSIKKYDHKAKTWETLTEKAENLATSPLSASSTETTKDTLYIISKTQKANSKVRTIKKLLADGKWEDLPDTPNAPRSITVDFLDRPWISDSLGEIYSYTGSSWLKQDGNLTEYDG